METGCLIWFVRIVFLGSIPINLLICSCKLSPNGNSMYNSQIVLRCLQTTLIALVVWLLLELSSMRLRFARLLREKTEPETKPEPKNFDLPDEPQ